MVSSANATFIKVAGHWHRLSIDYPVIFWRECKDEPRPWSVESGSFEHRQQDVGALAGIVGTTLTSCEAFSQGGCVSIVFGFLGGRKIEILGNLDATSYSVS
jgi:hypothetical protein